MSAVRWPTAARVAARLAGTYPLEDTYHFSLLARQAPALVERAAGLVEEETGLVGPSEPEVRVVTRRQWAEANIEVFAKLLEPAERKISERAGGVGKAVAGRLIAVEMGALLGLLSKRVLGQYEMVLPTKDGEAGDVVYLVGANLLAIERLHEFRPAQFRFWVALHECAHRLQFQGVPWMREYFFGLVSDMMEAATPEPGRVAKAATEMRQAAAAGEPMVTEAGLMGLLASDDQRANLDRIQALMSLLEGHGHVIMDRIGAREIPAARRMSQALRARRQDPRTKTFFRLVGLEMKFQQYELGERFVLGVEKEAGWRALDRVWESPEMLPNLDEIKEPQRWLTRVS